MFLLITLGSHGDVHPFFALAQELKRRGHEAVVATNSAFAKQAARAGVTLVELVDGLDVSEIMQTADVMHATRGPRVVLKDLLLPLVPKIHERTLELCRELRPAAAVIHPVCLGAHWACGRAGVPIVPAVLAPMGWMTSDDVRVMVPWRSYAPSLRASKFDAWAGKHIVRWMMDGSLNRVRRELGYPRGRDLLIGEFVRSDSGLNLGLWSPHLRGPCRGDPAGGVICGFPWFDDHHDHQASDADLNAFLDAGKPPIVFTLGTAAVHVPGDFYLHAARAAMNLKRRAILLIGRAEYAARYRDLPETIRAFTYAPFSTLLPRAAATVHHGGIGTTAQGMRAGKPTVVVPLAHDQFDNAARVKRLGVSETVHHAKATERALTDALAAVLERPEVASRAANIGHAMATENGAAVACEHLERIFAGIPASLSRDFPQVR